MTTIKKRIEELEIEIKTFEVYHKENLKKHNNSVNQMFSNVVMANDIRRLETELKALKFAKAEFLKMIDELQVDVDDGYHPVEKYVNVEALKQKLETSTNEGK